MPQRRHQEVSVGRHPADVEALERKSQAAGRFVPGRPTGDDLGEHGIEVEPDDGPRRRRRRPIGSPASAAGSNAVRVPVAGRKPAAGSSA